MYTAAFGAVGYAAIWRLSISTSVRALGDTRVITVFSGPPQNVIFSGLVSRIINGGCTPLYAVSGVLQRPAFVGSPNTCTQKQTYCQLSI